MGQAQEIGDGYETLGAPPCVRILPRPHRRHLQADNVYRRQTRRLADEKRETELLKRFHCIQ